MSLNYLVRELIVFRKLNVRITKTMFCSIVSSYVITTVFISKKSRDVGSKIKRKIVLSFLLGRVGW